ncbi:hypothetical protein ASC61_04790 [Aeromicrobium sp. Root344]|nr:hypothetical protein ASC61_04790 [Aeromicrobium sp. Root344]
MQAFDYFTELTRPKHVVTGSNQGRTAIHAQIELTSGNIGGVNIVRRATNAASDGDTQAFEINRRLNALD